MKLALLGLFLFISSATFAGDLTMPGERWEALPQGYICAAYGDQLDVPMAHQEMDLQFDYIRTDITLDNGILIGSFMENGTVCRFSAIMLADNAASTIELVESRAYSEDGATDCSQGKALLYQQLASNDYLYWGHPHRLTIMIPSESAEALCGAGSTHIGLNFQVSRKL